MKTPTSADDFSVIEKGSAYPETFYNPDHRYTVKLRYFRDGVKYGLVASAPHKRALGYLLVTLGNVVLDVVGRGQTVERFTYVVEDMEGPVWPPLGGDWKDANELATRAINMDVKV